MSAYEIVVIIIFAVVGIIVLTALSVWAITKLVERNRHLEENNQKLEERIAKLEDADAANVPSGYLFKDFVDNINAHNIAMQEHARVQRELLHQLRRGNVRIDKKNNGN